MTCPGVRGAVSVSSLSHRSCIRPVTVQTTRSGHPLCRQHPPDSRSAVSCAGRLPPRSVPPAAPRQERRAVPCRAVPRRAVPLLPPPLPQRCRLTVHVAIFAGRCDWRPIRRAAAAACIEQENVALTRLRSNPDCRQPSPAERAGPAGILCDWKADL